MDREAALQQAKERLNAAAARCLAGDISAADEADEAMAEIRALQRPASNRPTMPKRPDPV